MTTINYFAFPGMMNMATYMPTLTERIINTSIFRLYAVEIDQLKSKSRKQPLVRLRQCAMYLLRKNTDYSWKRIAEIYGGRDHSTAIHAYEAIEGALQGYNPDLKDIYMELEQVVMAEYVRKMTKFEQDEKV